MEGFKLLDIPPEEAIIITEFLEKVEEDAKHILLIPDFNLRKNVGRAYAYHSYDFYKFTKYKERYGDIEIYEHEKEIPALALHADETWLPTIVWFGQNLLLPFVVGLITNYVYSRMTGFKDEKNIVHVEIVHRNGAKKWTKMKYDGPVDGLVKIAEKIDKGLLK
jgi:hypothetical protein